VQFRADASSFSLRSLSHPAFDKKSGVDTALGSHHVASLYQDGISSQFFSGIWTCSPQYCCEFLARHHPQREVMYPMSSSVRTAFPESDREYVRLIKFVQIGKYFSDDQKLEICARTETLAAWHFKGRGHHAKSNLIIKVGPQIVRMGYRRWLSSSCETPKRSANDVLLRIADADVSRIIPEGWGLTLSTR